MRPLKLTLKGFIGIRDGMGRDEITLDFESLTGDIIAMIGPNGIGKSTILDNLHPYRIMPGRASSYSPNAFSYWGEIYGPEASKTLVWSHAGMTYRSVLIFRSTGKTQKGEAYLQVLNGAAGAEGTHWSEYVAPDRTVSDGKSTTYDVCVEQILGAPELYFTAAFSAQGRKLLSSYTNGEIKSLLASLLGLKHIEDLAAASNKRRAGAEAVLADARTRHGDGSQIETKRQQVANEKQAHGEREAALQSQIEVHRGEIDAASQALVDAKATAQQAESAVARRKSLQDQIDAMTTHERAETEAARRRRDETIAALDSTKSRAAADAARLERQIRDAETEITVQEHLLSERPEIEKAVTQTADMEANLEIVDRDLEQLDAKIGTLKDAQTNAAEIARKLSAHDEKIKALTAEIGSSRRRSQLIDEVPCAGMDLQSTCKLLADAKSAREQLATLESDLSAMGIGRDTLATELESAQTKANEWRALRNQHDQRSRERDTLLRQLSHVRTIAAKQASLEQAEAAVTRLRASLDEAKTALDKHRSDMDAEIPNLEKSLHEARMAIVEVQERYESMRKPLQAELSALPAAGTNGVADAEARLERAKTHQQELDRQLSAHRDQKVNILDRERQVEQEAAKAKAVADEMRALEDDVAAWTALSKALGPNGIIALVIDDAGPTIASLANDLLTACYGPRFTVRIETQHENKDGTLAEDFDITVFDALRDEQKSITKMSGGERIWINESLCRAVALYQAQQSGQHYECLMSDEADGALDVEKRQQFMAMKRKVLEIGHYEREIFISHSPDTWDVADATINLKEYAT